MFVDMPVGRAVFPGICGTYVHSTTISDADTLESDFLLFISRVEVSNTISRGISLRYLLLRAPPG